MSARVHPGYTGTMHQPPRETEGRRFTLGFVALVILTATLLPTAPEAPAGSAVAEVDPLQPATTGGLPFLDRSLARLSTHERLLLIAAHPDDEDTTLLTHVSRARGGEAAYFSLTRGEGGQNLLGEELGIGLGLLRSRELQAARQVDGARQFFARAYDFGYTRSPDETLRRWPLEILVDDALRVVRRFKPQVIVAVFPPDERAGHGHHQVSAVVAQDVFDAARAENEPWQPASLFRAAFFLRGDEPPTIHLPLGTVEPMSGRTIFQLAMASRSRHRCQDMGLLQPLGDAEGRLAWVAGAGESASRLFEGIDTSLSAIADPLEDEQLRRRVAVELDAVEAAAESSRADLSAVRLADDPRFLVSALSGIVGRLATVDSMLASGSSDRVRVVRQIVSEKRRIAHEALAAAAGLAIDAFIELDVSDPAVLIPGAEFDVRAQSWHEGSGRAEQDPVPELQTVRLTATDGSEWLPEQTLPPPQPRGFFTTHLDDDQVLRLRVPADAEPTVPYFLHRPLDGDLYDWSDVPEAVRGEPFGPPPLRARFEYNLQGVAFELEREVVFRIRDQARGEVRRPLRVVPPVEVALSDDLLIWSTDRDADPKRDVTVTLASHLGEPIDGGLFVRFQPLESAGTWTPANSLEPVRLEPATTITRALDLPRPEQLATGRYRIEVEFLGSDSTPGTLRMERSLQIIDYEHIRPVVRPLPAALELTVANIALPDVSRIGYVRGASDRVPDLLRELGLPLEILTAEQLAAAGDLTDFDAIVVGSRAYEADPAMGRANRNLLRYAEEGGLVVVQYQQYQFVRGRYAPYPLDIRRPHDRVTDESASVRMLLPNHPILSSPHRITSADWQGWVQERGLYFAGTWDDAYTPLLAMADPGRDEVRGSLLVAEVGRGRWVYTGLAFFRQLPAGVPGAYRLLMNLLAWDGTESDGYRRPAGRRGSGSG
ncbi:MAG: PIG-L family deacetylase [Thermoanaerobaculia bacterium]|nr:PIG-L family deacetylase [Thermoanaerobaculia bacterium]